MISYRLFELMIGGRWKFGLETFLNTKLIRTQVLHDFKVFSIQDREKHEWILDFTDFKCYIITDRFEYGIQSMRLESHYVVESKRE